MPLTAGPGRRPAGNDMDVSSMSFQAGTRAPIATSENSLESSLAITRLKINYTSNVLGRGTSTLEGFTIDVGLGPQPSAVIVLTYKFARDA